MPRSLSIALMLFAALALGACATSFSEAFPSPRRSARPGVAQPGTAQQVPPTYASSGAPLYAPPSYYGYGAAPDSGHPIAEPPGSTWDRPVPVPPAATAPSNACADTCDLANDGECDDGREGAGSDLCVPGTDCSDCGA